MKTKKTLTSKNIIPTLEPSIKPDVIRGIVEERQNTHGDFKEVALTSHCLKTIFRDADGWKRLSWRQREAFDCIAIKIARVLHGNPMFQDHWADIEGYARLARDSIHD